MGTRVLVVDDERSIAEAVSARLLNEGFDVELAHDGLSAIELCESWDPHLVVLDLMLPGIDGLEVCRRIQQLRRTPVLMLTARDDETDMLVGFGVGADDYLTKPFSPRELVARIHAILRRADQSARTVTQIEPLPGLVLDGPRRTVHMQNVEVHLTATEFDLLWTLATVDGGVLTREQLLNRVWGYRDANGARTVDSHVRAVRRKLFSDVIRTVHAVGYAFGVEGTP